MRRGFVGRNRYGSGKRFSRDAFRGRQEFERLGYSRINRGNEKSKSSASLVHLKSSGKGKASRSGSDEAAGLVYPFGNERHGYGYLVSGRSPRILYRKGRFERFIVVERGAVYVGYEDGVSKRGACMVTVAERIHPIAPSSESEYVPLIVRKRSRFRDRFGL